jgi:hypothetical protein
LFRASARSAWRAAQAAGPAPAADACPRAGAACVAHGKIAMAAATRRVAAEEERGAALQRGRGRHADAVPAAPPHGGCRRGCGRSGPRRSVRCRGELCFRPSHIGDDGPPDCKGQPLPPEGGVVRLVVCSTRGQVHAGHLASVLGVSPRADSEQVHSANHTHRLRTGHAVDKDVGVASPEAQLSAEVDRKDAEPAAHVLQ